MDGTPVESGDDRRVLGLVSLIPPGFPTAGELVVLKYGAQATSGFPLHHPWGWGGVADPHDKRWTSAQLRSAKATLQTCLQDVPHSLPDSTSALILSTRTKTPTQVPRRLRTHVVLAQEATSQLSQEFRRG